MKILLFLICALGMIAAACTSPSENQKRSDNPNSDDALRREGNRSVESSEINEDLRITQKIRESLYDDTSLSLSAKNIKIEAKEGQVTLMGNVKNEKERNDIAAKVQTISGVKKVENKLYVSSDAL